MGIYRRIEVHTWVDTKFKNLSPIKPSGQALWFYLLTGPQTGIIPGLFKAGHAAMAEDLGWLAKDFEEAFGEVLREGLAKDSLKDRLIWIPNAIKYNPPTSPNVIRSWASAMDTLPECDLLKEAIEYMRAEIYLLDKKEIKGFAKAFDEVFGKALAKDFPKALPKGNANPSPNQEQEQEQYSGSETVTGKEGESARASDPAPAPREDTPSPSFSKPEAKTEDPPLYGKFKNVALSDDDYQGLLFDYGEAKTMEYINRLSSWLAEDSGRKCENANAKITHWLIDDKVKPYIHTATPETRPDPVEKGKGPLDGELAPEVQEAMRAGAFSKAFRGAGPIEIPKLPKSRESATAAAR